MAKAPIFVVAEQHSGGSLYTFLTVYKLCALQKVTLIASYCHV